MIMKTKKSVYYTLEEIYKEFCAAASTLPYTNKNLKEISDDIFDAAPSYPITLIETNIVNLWKEIYARFYNEPIIKIDLPFYASIPTLSIDTDFRNEMLSQFQKWFLRVISIISRTYNYYNTLLGAYADAQSHLMEDIKATSKNTIKYNETPQNINTEGVYEGDDHLTNFTKTEGENVSPLTSKIMRLKEIQDHYKRTLDDWVNEFHQVFYEEGDLE